MSFDLSSFGNHVCICGPPLWLELEMSLAVVVSYHVHACVTWPLFITPSCFHFLIFSLLTAFTNTVKMFLLSLQWEDLLAVPACSELCRKRELSPIHLPLPSRSAAPAWKGHPSSIAPPSQEYPVQVSAQANSVYYSGIPLNTNN